VQINTSRAQRTKEPWNYDHPEHKTVTKQIAEMIAIDSHLFLIVEGTGFIRLLVYVSLRYIAPSRKYFSALVHLPCIIIVNKDL